MLNRRQQRTLASQLTRIEARVRGLRETAPAECVDMLQQLATLEASLRAVGRLVVQYHVADCVPEGLAQSEPEGRARLAELVDIFDRL